MSSRCPIRRSCGHVRREPGRHPSPCVKRDQPLSSAKTAHGLAQGSCRCVYICHDTIDALVHHAPGSLGMPCRAVAHGSESVMCCVRSNRGSPSTVGCRSRIRSRHIFRGPSLLLLSQLVYLHFIGRVQCQQYIKLAGETRQTIHRELWKYTTL